MIAENPKIVTLSPYKGFRITKVTTYSEWRPYVSYEAVKGDSWKTREWIECDSLKELKKEINEYYRRKDNGIHSEGEA